MPSQSRRGRSVTVRPAPGSRIRVERVEATCLERKHVWAPGSVASNHQLGLMVPLVTWSALYEYRHRSTWRDHRTRGRP